ncbi:hypothetical protein WA158_007849 [Blastocystis sp. Blastoise]
MSQAKRDLMQSVPSQQAMYSNVPNIIQGGSQYGYNNIPQNYSVGYSHHMTPQQQQLALFWSQTQKEINQADANTINKHCVQLPMARIKKIMKTDESVRSCMIGSEAPILLAKACEIFMRELTIRAWVHTEEGKRRTLQKMDISSAVSKSDTFDFLIDIVPREDTKASRKEDVNKVIPYEAMFMLYQNNASNSQMQLQGNPMMDTRINPPQPMGMQTNNQQMNPNMSMSQPHIPQSMPTQDMMYASAYGQRMMSQPNTVQPMAYQQQQMPQGRMQQNYNPIMMR